MESSTPRLEIYPQRIEENGRAVINAFHKHGAQVACVTKVIRAHPAVVDAMVAAGADMLADARIPNLETLMEYKSDLPRLLLRVPTPSQALEVVRCSDYSLNSSLITLERLSLATQALNKNHSVIIMIELGDLREGIQPADTVAFLRSATRFDGINIIGLGCNLACYGGVMPTAENMQQLVSLRDICRRETGLALDLLSGGNSSALPLLHSGDMPPEINHFRVGESILLGRNVLDRSPWPNTRQDAFRVVAEVIELEYKPSIPIGLRGQDAFGNQTEFVDRGFRHRAICNIGRQDILLEGLTPQDQGIFILGASSDHLILDVEDADATLVVGQEISFFPNYGALLAASTSDYVIKVVLPG